jgi:hypothetical protein
VDGLTIVGKITDDQNVNYDNGKGWETNMNDNDWGKKP